MNIKELRLKLNLTQEQMSHKLKVSLATVNRWENGKSAARDLTHNLREYAYLQYVSARQLGSALRRGELPQAGGQKCMDCDKWATCYDHRDYFLPLKVDPVCTSCNAKRGLAWATIEKLLALDDPSQLIPDSHQGLTVLNREGHYIHIELPDHIHLAAKTAAEKTGVQMKQWLADAVEAACVFTAHGDPVIRAILDEGRKPKTRSE